MRSSSLLSNISPRLLSSYRSSLRDHIIISEEIKSAQSEGKGVVALESTVITHGLPYPTNLQTGRSLEKVIRENGAIPATIALIGGKIKVGLNDSELEMISQDKKAVKVSRRDMAYTLTKGLTGGTTVASTMWCAHESGIDVFSTGGIGGVHRGAEETFDISADLIELSRTPVTVVCAGIKSILDIGKTLEVLETQGVNTLVYSSKNSFPGFFTSQTDFTGQTNSTDINEIADIIRMSLSLGLPAGTILAVPLPKEFESQGKILEDAIQTALEEAKNKNIRGQSITPFLLSRVAEMTKGMSMKTNVALLENNARVAAKLSISLSEKKKKNENTSRVVSTQKSMKKSNDKSPKVVVVGASILDFESITSETLKEDGGSYIGRIVQRVGGVGRNHSEAIGRMNINSTLLSSIANDSHGDFIVNKTEPYVDLSHVLTVRDGTPTAVYMSMNQRGNVLYGISSIEDIIQKITPQYISDNEDIISTADYIVSDGNLPIPTLSKLLELAKYHNRKVWYEPTDIAKATKFLECSSRSSVSIISPNGREFISILHGLGIEAPSSILSSPSTLISFLINQPPRLSSLDIILITMAEHGSVLISRDYVAPKYKVLETSWGNMHIIPPPSTNIVSVSGAGDTMNSSLLSSLLHSCSLEESIDISLQAVSMTLQSINAVSEDLSTLNLPWR